MHVWAQMADSKLLFYSWLDANFPEDRYTQEGLAGILGIKQSQVQSYRRRKTAPTLDTLDVICENAGVSPAEILAGQKPKPRIIQQPLTEQLREEIREVAYRAAREAAEFTQRVLNDPMIASMTTASEADLERIRSLLENVPEARGILKLGKK